MKIVFTVSDSRNSVSYTFEVPVADGSVVRLSSSDPQITHEGVVEDWHTLELSHEIHSGTANLPTPLCYPN